jgi:leader peptidase (prepilin peptidase)/N-methyltransferase
MFVLGWVGFLIDALVGDRFDRLADAGLGALIFGGFFFLIAMIVPAGMGGGDVKLAFVLGSFLGYAAGPGEVLVGMFLSFLIGGVVGIAVMVAGRGGRKTQIPFGPFLALGTTIAIFLGEGILDLYLGTAT